MRRFLFVALACGFCSTANADSFNGIWVERGATAEIGQTMTVQSAGSGHKLTYTFSGSAGKNIRPMAIVSAFDGSEAPLLVDGKPSGQTMAIRMLDEHHWVSALKFQGQPTGMSKAELSPDGKVLKIENDNQLTGPNGVQGKSVQYWDRQ